MKFYISAKFALDFGVKHFYAFWWTQKNSFTPLNCWVTKLTLRWLLSLKRPLTSIRSEKVGEIQCSMTKVVFVLDFWLWEYFAERRRFLSCRAGCCSQWSDRGTGRQNGGIATDALDEYWASSSPEHSRQCYQKINTEFNLLCVTHFRWVHACMNGACRRSTRIYE